jgi:enamine deaminase RidA (YjgF/YER057c/UK114 family)
MAIMMQDSDSHTRFELLQPSSRHVPRGYTHGVVVPAGSRPVYVAGQLGSDERGVVVAGGLLEQFARALDNVIAVVADAGGRAGDIASMRIFIADFADYNRNKKAIAVLWAARFGEYYPATAIVEVSGLINPAAKVEIEAVAHV